jgi:hypothetical protein
MQSPTGGSVPGQISNWLAAAPYGPDPQPLGAVAGAERSRLGLPPRRCIGADLEQTPQVESAIILSRHQLRADDSRQRQCSVDMRK